MRMLEVFMVNNLNVSHTRASVNHIDISKDLWGVSEDKTQL